VLETTVSAKTVPYSHILVLDSRLRDFYVPSELDMFGPEGSSNVRPLLMQQSYVTTSIHICIYSTIKQILTCIDVSLCSTTSASPELLYPGAEWPRAVYSQTQICAFCDGNVLQCKPPHHYLGDSDETRATPFQASLWLLVQYVFGRCK